MPEPHLTILTKAERMLAEARTIPELRDIIDMAEVARVAAKESRLGTNAVNHATRIKLSAERRLADAVDEGQRRGEIATQGKGPDSGPLLTLSDLEIKRQRLEEARLIRDAFTDEELRQRVAMADDQDRILSRDRLLRIARDAGSNERSDDKARRTAQAQERPQSSDIRSGDFRSVLLDIPEGSVDAIITDPPYAKEYLYVFGDLAKFADRVLSPDGVLAVMTGQSHLPSVFSELEGGRPYRWTMAYLTPVHGYSAYARRVQSNWKPVLVYGGGPRFTDVIHSAPPDKRLHVWGQDLGGFAEVVERLTEPEAVVCDPFLGAGTTALAAASLGRRFIGCDIDPDAVAAAESRLLPIELHDASQNG